MPLRNFLSPEFRKKFQREVPLFCRCPNFLRAQCTVSQTSIHGKNQLDPSTRFDRLRLVMDRHRHPAIKLLPAPAQLRAIMIRPLFTITSKHFLICRLRDVKIVHWNSCAKIKNCFVLTLTWCSGAICLGQRQYRYSWNHCPVPRHIYRTDFSTSATKLVGNKCQ